MSNCIWKHVNEISVCVSSSSGGFGIWIDLKKYEVRQMQWDETPKKVVEIHGVNYVDINVNNVNEKTFGIWYSAIQPYSNMKVSFGVWF